MAAISLRMMTKADLDDIVNLHQLAFQGFFIEQMGPSFIKAYYNILLAYEGSIAYVYVGKYSGPHISDNGLSCYQR